MKREKNKGTPYNLLRLLLALCLLALASGGASAEVAFDLGRWNDDGTGVGNTMHRYVRFGEWTWRVLEVSSDKTMFLVTSDDLYGDGTTKSFDNETPLAWSWGTDTDIVKTISTDMYSKLETEELAALVEGKFANDDGNYSHANVEPNADKIKIGLLSINEAGNLKYFADNTDRKISSNTPYWLRSLGNDSLRAAVVLSFGIVAPGGNRVDVLCAVRPASLLNLQSVILKSGFDFNDLDSNIGSSRNPWMLYCTSADLSPASASVNGNKLILVLDASDQVVHAYADTPSGTELATRFTIDSVTPATTVLSADVTGGIVTLHLSRALSSDEMPKVVYEYTAGKSDGLASISKRAVLKTFTQSSSNITNVASADFTPASLKITGTVGTPITVQKVGVAAVPSATLQSIAAPKKPAWLTVSDDIASGSTSATIEFLGTPTAAGSGRFEVSVTTDEGTTSMYVTYVISAASTGGDPDNTDTTKTPVTIDGEGVASVSTSVNTVTITWLDEKKPNTTYDLAKNRVTVTYGDQRFTVTLNAVGELVVTGDGELLPDGTTVVLTATNTAAPAALQAGRAARAGASYSLGEAKAAIIGGKCVFTFPAEQVSKLPGGTYDLTFSTKSGANPAFKGTFAKGYVHVVSEPATPEILLDASETASGGGVQVSATVTSGDAPQPRVTVQFTLANRDNTHVTSLPRTTDAAGTVPAFVLDTGLANGTYTVTAAATGYAPVSKTVTVTKGESSGGDEEEEGELSSSGGGCDAGFGLLAMLAIGAAIKRRS